MLGDRPGHDPGRSTVVLGAHHDCVSDSPEADDNASRVALLLGL